MLAYRVKPSNSKCLMPGNISILCYRKHFSAGYQEFINDQKFVSPYSYRSIAECFSSAVGIQCSAWLYSTLPLESRRNRPPRPSMTSRRPASLRRPLIGRKKTAEPEKLPEIFCFGQKLGSKKFPQGAETSQEPMRKSTLTPTFPHPCQTSTGDGGSPTTTRVAAAMKS